MPSIVVDEGEYKGVWVPPVTREWYPHVSERSLLEMQVGRENSVGVHQKAGVINIADDDQWKRLLGMVAFGVAKLYDP